MIPAANSAKVSSPAIGRKASAACAAVSILVIPWAFNVTAVVTMMKKAMRFEISIPVQVSIEMCLKKSPVGWRCERNFRPWLKRESSASCEACQNRWRCRSGHRRRRPWSTRARAHSKSGGAWSLRPTSHSLYPICCSFENAVSDVAPLRKQLCCLSGSAPPSGGRRDPRSFCRGGRRDLPN